jgi:hypothetical protein
MGPPTLTWQVHYRATLESPEEGGYYECGECGESVTRDDSETHECRCACGTVREDYDEATCAKCAPSEDDDD